MGGGVTSPYDTMNPTKTIVIIAVAVIMTVYIVYPLTENPGADANTLDVIIIDGQSNAEYNQYCNVNALDLPVPNHKLLYYGTESAANKYPGTTSTGVYEMCRNGYWKIGGLEPTLAYYYSLNTNHPVLTINVARGAMSISWLSSDGVTYAQEVINAALAEVSGYKINYVGWVMLQGEADDDMEVDTYKDYFLVLEDYFKSIGCPSCYIAKTRAYWGGNSVTAQEELCEEYPDIHMATTVSDTFADGSPYVMPVSIHYTQLGRNVIGEDLGIYIAKDHDMPGQSILIVIPIILVIGIILLAARIVVNRND